MFDISLLAPHVLQQAGLPPGAIVLQRPSIDPSTPVSGPSIQDRLVCTVFPI